MDDNDARDDMDRFAGKLALRMTVTAAFRDLALVLPLFFLIGAVAAFVAPLIGLPLNDRPVLFLVAGIGVIAMTLVRTVRRRPSRRRALGLVDTKLRKRSLMTTAYELMERYGGESSREGVAEEAQDQSGPTAHERIVMSRAWVVARRLDPALVHRYALPANAFYTPLAAVVFMLALALAPQTAMGTVSPWDGFMAQLQPQVRQLHRSASEANDPEGIRLAREIERLQGTLSRRPDQQRAYREIQELLPRLEEYMRELGPSDFVSSETAPGVLEGQSESRSLLRAVDPQSAAAGARQGIPATGENRSAEPAPEQAENVRQLQRTLNELAQALDGDLPAGGDEPGDASERDDQWGRIAQSDGPGSEEGRSADPGNLPEADETGAAGSGEGSDGSGGPTGANGPAGSQFEANEDRSAGDGPGRGGSGGGAASDEAGNQARADLGATEAPRLADVVNQLWKLPDGAGRTPFSELMTRSAPPEPEPGADGDPAAQEGPGPDGESASEGEPAADDGPPSPGQAGTTGSRATAGSGQFERQLETVIASQPIPTDLKPLVRDYFIRLNSQRQEQ